MKLPCVAADRLPMQICALFRGLSVKILRCQPTPRPALMVLALIFATFVSFRTYAQPPTGPCANPNACYDSSSCTANNTVTTCQHQYSCTSAHIWVQNGSCGWITSQTTSAITNDTCPSTTCAHVPAGSCANGSTCTVSSDCIKTGLTTGSCPKYECLSQQWVLNNPPCTTVTNESGGIAQTNCPAMTCPLQ
jgi:hypothetical protein